MMETMQMSAPPVKPGTNWGPALGLMAILCVVPGGILIVPLLLAPLLISAARQAQDTYDREVAAYNAYYGISTFLRPLR